MKKAAGIFVGLVIGWAAIQWLIDRPGDAAKAVNSAGDGVGDAGSGVMTFVGALSGAGLLVLGGVILAIYLSRR